MPGPPLAASGNVCGLLARARQRVLRELRRLAASRRRDFPITSVYVFGSFARGVEHEGSNIDLMVVGELTGRLFDRVDEGWRLV